VTQSSDQRLDRRALLGAGAALALGAVWPFEALAAGAAKVPEARSGFRMPTATGRRLGDGYFERVKRVTCKGSGRIVHAGVDFAGPGQVAYAVADGLVVYSSDEDKDGEADNWGGLVVEHLYRGETYYSQYGHLDKLYARVGWKVKKGQALGTIDEPHLHLEIRTVDHPAPRRGAFWDCEDFQDPKNVASWYVNPAKFIRTHGPY